MTKEENIKTVEAQSILFSAASRILSFAVLSPEDLEKPTDADENKRVREDFEKHGGFPRTRVKGFPLKNGGLLYIVLNLRLSDATWFLDKYTSSFMLVSRRNLKDDFTFEYYEKDPAGKYQEADPCGTVFEEIFKDHDLVYEPLERFDRHLNEILAEKNEYYDKELERVVYTMCDGWCRYVSRQFLYETKEGKKERLERLKESDKRMKEWEEKRRKEEEKLKKLQKRFAAFERKYNDAVKTYNSKRKTILGGESSVQLGGEERKLIEGKYKLNPDGTIDINGNFTMHEIYDLDVDMKTWEEDPVFVIDEFPFKLGRVTGDFVIFSTSLKDLDMFPRSVEGGVSVCCNDNLTSVEGVAGSSVDGECLIESKAETLYFPDYVGGDLIVDSRFCKDFCTDKTVRVGGCFSFCNMSSTDPQADEIKKTVRAKRYEFKDRNNFSGNRERVFFTIGSGEKWLNCRIFEHEDPIDGKPFFHVEPASVWAGVKWEICMSLEGGFLKAVNTGERKSTNRFTDVEKFIKEWLPKPCSGYPKITNFVHVQIMWNDLNPDSEIKIKEWE